MESDVLPALIGGGSLSPPSMGAVIQECKRNARILPRLAPPLTIGLRCAGDEAGGRERHDRSATRARMVVPGPGRSAPDAPGDRFGSGPTRPGHDRCRRRATADPLPDSQEIVIDDDDRLIPQCLAVGYLFNQNMLVADDVLAGIDYDEETKPSSFARRAHQLRTEAEPQSSHLGLRPGNAVRRRAGEIPDQSGSIRTRCCGRPG